MILYIWGIVHLNSLESEHRGRNRHRCRHGLHVQDFLAGRRRAIHAGNAYTSQKEQSDLLSKSFHRVRKSPEEPCGKKAVVEALVGRQHFGLCGEIGRQLEGFVAAGGVPQEHLQGEDVDVDGAYGAGGYFREESHCTFSS